MNEVVTNGKKIASPASKTISRLVQFEEFLNIILSHCNEFLCKSKNRILKPSSGTKFKRNMGDNHFGNYLL